MECWFKQRGTAGFRGVGGVEAVDELATKKVFTRPKNEEAGPFPLFLAAWIAMKLRVKVQGAAGAPAAKMEVPIAATLDSLRQQIVEQFFPTEDMINPQDLHLSLNRRVGMGHR
jgi:hypothetical protein